MLLFVTPTGFEPISSEPESEILSIELWGPIYYANIENIFIPISLFKTHNATEP